jgi:hypothetical protein
MGIMPKYDKEYYERRCKELEAHVERLRGTLTEISNMCIGEIAMGYRLDAESIGQLIYEATGKTNPELNSK